MLNKIRNDLKKKYPQDICDALIDTYVKIKEEFYLGRLEPSELNSGKFVEACLRLLQEELTQTHTPIGQEVPNVIKTLRDFELADKKHNDSYRIHIPRILIAVYSIRNKRGVGHLGGDINPNVADATMVVTAADWVLAELYRILYTAPLQEAQQVVNDLVKRKLPLVHEIGDITRILDTSISFRDQTLILLYSNSEGQMTEEKLVQCLEYSNPSYFRSKVLKTLHKDRFIEYSETTCTILPPGIKYVESHYSDWLNKFNEGGTNG